MSSSHLLLPPLIPQNCLSSCLSSRRTATTSQMRLKTLILTPQTRLGAPSRPKNISLPRPLLKPQARSPKPTREDGDGDGGDTSLIKQITQLTSQLEEAATERDLYGKKLKALILAMASMEDENRVLREENEKREWQLWRAGRNVRAFLEWCADCHPDKSVEIEEESRMQDFLLGNFYVALFEKGTNGSYV